MDHQDKQLKDLRTFQALKTLVEQLRAPGGCPWDIEQTHQSLKRNLLEECYEALEAIDIKDPQKISEELGDLLLQIMFHCDIGSKAGQFTLEDIILSTNEKLIRRHPHVFGDTKISDPQEIEHNWERIKRLEKKGKSPAEDIPDNLPALAYAQLIQERASKAGFDWDNVSGVLLKISEEIMEINEADGIVNKTNEVGDLLFTLVNFARWHGIHAENALRGANQRFKKRYLTMESLASQKDVDFVDLPLIQKERLWEEAKRLVERPTAT